MKLVSLTLALTLFVFGLPAMAATGPADAAVTPSIIRYMEKEVQRCYQLYIEDDFPIEHCATTMVTFAVVETIQHPVCTIVTVAAAAAGGGVGSALAGVATASVCTLVTEQ